MRQGKIGVALDRSRQVFSRAAGVAFAKPGHECLERFWIAAVAVAGFRRRLLQPHLQRFQYATPDFVLDLKNRLLDQYLISKSVCPNSEVSVGARTNHLRQDFLTTHGPELLAEVGTN